MAELSTSSKSQLSEDERSPSIASITSKDSTNLLTKYLHPGDAASDMESTSEAPTDQSIAGSPSRKAGSSINTGKSGADEKSSATTSGPDSDVGSVDDLPIDDDTSGDADAKGVAADVSSKVTASASYIGSFFTSAWNKTAKTANEATHGSSAFFSSALQKVGGSSTKPSPKEEEPKSVVVKDPSAESVADAAADAEKSPTNETASASIVTSSSSFFSSAWNKVGEITKSVSTSAPGKAEPAEAPKPDQKPDEPEKPEDAEAGEKQGSFFSSFSTMVTKVASDASHIIKDKVGTSVATNLITEFNREQEEFIKTKGHNEVGLAPWVGQADEAGMKEKILCLSEDKRNFVRAPPSGVTFDFDYAAVAPVALAILAEDPKLDKMRYELVPKVVKEDEFWRNYFYRLNLVKQSFDLKDLESGKEASKKPTAPTTAAAAKTAEKFAEDDDHQNSNVDADDEFVSDAFQASSKDLDEVNENMKRLGVKNTDEEWEAELEGELNEFEVVSSKDGSPQNQEWENEIETMLDAEDGGK